MTIANASLRGKTVSDPCAAYDSIKDLWRRCRAVCSGERFVKDYDSIIDTNNFNNLLIPFSRSMSQQQYNFFKAEAELPGIVAQYVNVVVGGLLRKQPQLKLPDDAPEGAYTWIMDGFGQDSSPILSFLDRALHEELQTSRAWVYVDYPLVKDADSMIQEDFLKIKPYPVLWNAESVINWEIGDSSEDGAQDLKRIIIRNYSKEYSPENEFHPLYLDTVWVHELDDQGYYQIRKFQKPYQDNAVPVMGGKVQQNYNVGAVGGGGNLGGPSNANNHGFFLLETITGIMANGERLRQIPAWPLNGNIEISEPIMIPLIDREVHLYNKISRRNHLLYGASTYTPVICSDMNDDAFQAIVDGGLGSWIHLRMGESADVLKTPTDALADMDRTIAATIEEMAKMGIRMLTAETAQSGVALEIRNASQTATLGTLSTKVSNQMADIICFMINWRYNTSFVSTDIQFQLADNLTSMPIDFNWMSLVTQWYQQGLIPRSVWLHIGKASEIVPVDYNDEEGQEEMAQDAIANSGGLPQGQAPGGNMSYANQLQQQNEKVVTKDAQAEDEAADPTIGKNAD
jgi:hypothetical protein